MRSDRHALDDYQVRIDFNGVSVQLNYFGGEVNEAHSDHFFAGFPDDFSLENHVSSRVSALKDLSVGSEERKYGDHEPLIHDGPVGGVRDLSKLGEAEKIIDSTLAVLSKSEEKWRVQDIAGVADSNAQILESQLVVAAKVVHVGVSGVKMEDSQQPELRLKNGCIADMTAEMEQSSQPVLQSDFARVEDSIAGIASSPPPEQQSTVLIPVFNGEKMQQNEGVQEVKECYEDIHFRSSLDVDLEGARLMNLVQQCEAIGLSSQVQQIPQERTLDEERTESTFEVVGLTDDEVSTVDCTDMSEIMDDAQANLLDAESPTMKEVKEEALACVPVQEPQPTCEEHKLREVYMHPLPFVKNANFNTPSVKKNDTASSNRSHLASSRQFNTSSGLILPHYAMMAQQRQGNPAPHKKVPLNMYMPGSMGNLLLNMHCRSTDGNSARTPSPLSLAPSSSSARTDSLPRSDSSPFSRNSQSPFARTISSIFAKAMPRMISKPEE